MDDLISRQQAIDALIRVPGIGNRALDKIRELPSAQPEELDTLIKALEKEHRRLIEMQKAQPEIIRCKDCKFNPKYEWFGCPMSHLSEKQRPEAAWCWKAERRTDE